MKPFTYLTIDLACLSVPFVVSFHPRAPFYKDWKYFFPASLIVATLFLLWDACFTQLGVWGFNPDYLIGFYLLNLPLEEVLFFLCIPYACVFTYYTLKHWVEQPLLCDMHRSLSVFLSVVLLAVGLYSFDRAYTCATAFALAAYLLFCLKQRSDLSDLYRAYAVILPFFSIANGLLTGTWLEAPIVWYNNAQNLGIRLGTIPIEDSLYGLLLIALNIHLYEYFKSKSSHKSKRISLQAARTHHNPSKSS